VSFGLTNSSIYSSTLPFNEIGPWNKFFKNARTFRPLAYFNNEAHVAQLFSRFEVKRNAYLLFKNSQLRGKEFYMSNTPQILFSGAQEWVAPLSVARFIKNVDYSPSLVRIEKNDPVRLVFFSKKKKLTLLENNSGKPFYIIAHGDATPFYIDRLKNHSAVDLIKSFFSVSQPYSSSIFIINNVFVHYFSSPNDPPKERNIALSDVLVIKRDPWDFPQGSILSGRQADGFILFKRDKKFYEYLVVGSNAYASNPREITEQEYWQERQRQLAFKPQEMSS
jgi:hypothetical protein